MADLKPSAKPTDKFHGTVTARRTTKTGHTILQVDGQDEYVLLGQDERSAPIEIFDNVLFSVKPGPTVVEFRSQQHRKPQLATLYRPGMFVITVQLSDKSLNAVRRQKQEKGMLVVGAPIAAQPAATTAAGVTLERRND